MRIFLTLLIATTSLLRPNLVLCFEPTGDVRVELQECCEPSLDNLGMNAESEEACDGCFDLVLTTHSLATKRATVDTPLLLAAIAFPGALDAHRVTTPVPGTGNDTARAVHSSRLSTTIIRC